MSSHAPRPRPRIVIPPRKHVEYEQPPSLGSGYISPDLQPNTPPTFPGPSSEDSHCGVSKIGRYLLTKLVDTVGIVDIYDAYHCDTQQEYVCKVGWLLMLMLNYILSVQNNGIGIWYGVW